MSLLLLLNQRGSSPGINLLLFRAGATPAALAVYDTTPPAAATVSTITLLGLLGSSFARVAMLSAPSGGVSLAARQRVLAQGRAAQTDRTSLTAHASAMAAGRTAPTATTALTGRERSIAKARAATTPTAVLTAKAKAQSRASASQSARVFLTGRETAMARGRATPSGSVAVQGMAMMKAALLTSTAVPPVNASTEYIYFARHIGRI